MDYALINPKYYDNRVPVMWQDTPPRFMTNFCGLMITGINLTAVASYCRIKLEFFAPTGRSLVSFTSDMQSVPPREIITFQKTWFSLTAYTSGAWMAKATMWAGEKVAATWEGPIAYTTGTMQPPPAAPVAIGEPREILPRTPEEEAALREELWRTITGVEYYEDIVQALIDKTAQAVAIARPELQDATEIEKWAASQAIGEAILKGTTVEQAAQAGVSAATAVAQGASTTAAVNKAVEEATGEKPTGIEETWWAKNQAVVVLAVIVILGIVLWAKK